MIRSEGLPLVAILPNSIPISGCSARCACSLLVIYNAHMCYNVWKINFDYILYVTKIMNEKKNYNTIYP